MHYETSEQMIFICHRKKTTRDHALIYRLRPKVGASSRLKLVANAKVSRIGFGLNVAANRFLC